MTDPLTAISTILGSIKTAADIAQLLKNSDLSLEKAELKLKLAELVGALADAKIEIAGVQELVSEKDKKIKSLEQAADISNKVKYQAPYYWLVDGTSKDGPFCQQCRDKDEALIRLQGHGNGSWECKTCKNTYTDSSYRHEIGRTITDDD
jgi:tRNA(Ile2) C34 agmatinyltransferase TiaS